MDPLRGGRYGIPPEGMGRPDLNPVGGGMYGIPPDGRGIGRSDLDPLGGFGSDPGGMIFPFPYVLHCSLRLSYIYVVLKLIYNTYLLTSEKYGLEQNWHERTFRFVKKIN